ncbi:DUF6973 domain-containing protein [Salegentibacter sp. HM20]
MSVWSRLRDMSPRELFELSRVCFKQPKFIYPTFQATRESLKLCDNAFGKAHHGNNPTNAFRHAYWNYLIAKKCFAICNSEETAISWAKRITDLHEELAPNAPLERAVDLHNNEIGRQVFLNQKSGGLEVLKLMMNDAVKVESLAEVVNFPNNMIYTEDDK